MLLGAVRGQRTGQDEAAVWPQGLSGTQAELSPAVMARSSHELCPLWTRRYVELAAAPVMPWLSVPRLLEPAAPAHGLPAARGARVGADGQAKGMQKPFRRAGRLSLPFGSSSHPVWAALTLCGAALGGLAHPIAGPGDAFLSLLLFQAPILAAPGCPLSKICLGWPRPTQRDAPQRQAVSKRAACGRAALSCESTAPRRARDGAVGALATLPKPPQETELPFIPLLNC